MKSDIDIKKYNYLINSDCIKLIHGEFILIVFFLVCMSGLIPAMFNSERWMVSISHTSISLYYFYPVLLGVSCLFWLFFNIFNYYRYVIFSFYFKDDFLVLNICGLKSIQFKSFYVIVNKYRIGHLNGFKKEYFNCIAVKGNKKVYLIPVIKSKQDELIQILLSHGGELN